MNPKLPSRSQRRRRSSSAGVPPPPPACPRPPHLSGSEGQIGRESEREGERER